MISKQDIHSGIIGAVTADALGVPYEFTEQSQMKDNPATDMTGYGTYHQPPGTWSDDSSMTLATLDSLCKGIDYDDMMKRFSQWIHEAKYTPYDEVFDYGNTTYWAINNYPQKEALKCGLTDERSNGNGSLMRILPITMYLNAKKMDTKKQMKIVNNTSALTHAHQISKASCNIYNFIVQEILENKNDDFSEVIKKGIDKSRKFYENPEYPCFDRIYTSLFTLTDDEIYSKGYVVYSLEVALYSCYHTDNYKKAVLKAVNYGGDTDTNAMIAGGLAGLYYGIDDIPKDWQDTIAKMDYIKGLCDNFYESLE